MAKPAPAGKEIRPESVGNNNIMASQREKSGDMATDETASTQDKMMRRQNVVMRSVSAHASGELNKNDYFALNFVDCIQNMIRKTNWTYLQAE